MNINNNGLIYLFFFPLKRNENNIKEITNQKTISNTNKGKEKVVLPINPPVW